MFDWAVAVRYCRRCGTPLDGGEETPDESLLDCPRCRGSALRLRQGPAVPEEQILAWLDEE